MKRFFVLMSAFVVCASTVISCATPDTSTSEIKTSEIKSIYDGTYTGTFNYEYQQVDIPVEGPDKRGPWIPASFTLTLTFKTLSKDLSDDLRSVYLDVTNVIISDPAFKTGSSGVDPGPYDPVGNAVFPVNPSKLSDKNYAGYAPELHMRFPMAGDSRIFTRDSNDINGSYAIKVSLDGKTLSNNPDYIMVGLDGKTLSNNPDFITHRDHYSWQAYTYEGILYPGSVFNYRAYKFKNWSLTKID